MTLTTLTEVDAEHSCGIPYRYNCYATAMPVRQIALCEECGQHWLLTWTNGYGFGSYWLPVDKRISPRRAKRLLRKWSK